MLLGYCGSNNFKCRNGYCIDKDLVGDSYTNCPSGMDENQRTTLAATVRPPTIFASGNMTGIILSLVCAAISLVVLALVIVKVRHHLLNVSIIIYIFIILPAVLDKIG